MIKWWFTALISILTFQVNGQLPTWTMVDLQEQLSIRHIEVDTLGFLWLTTQQKLYKFNGYDLIPAETDQDLGELTSFYKAANHLFYLGNSIGEIYEYNPYEFDFRKISESRDSLPIDRIYFEDDQHYVTVSYGNHLYIYWDDLDSKLSIESGLVSNEIYDIYIQNKEIMLATDQGLQHLKLGENIQLNPLKNLNENISDVITTHIIRTQDELWISDFTQTLNKVSPDSSVVQYAFETPAKINKLVKFRDLIFIARDDGLYQLKDEKLSKIFPFEGNQKVKTFTIDEEENLWIPENFKGLHKGNLLFRKYTYELPNIQNIYKNARGMWVGTREGLYLIENQEIRKISENNIISIEEMNDRIWVGTYASGVKLYNQNGQETAHIDSWLQVENESVLALYPHDDHMYVSSLTGVMKMKFITSATGEKILPVESLTSQIGQSYTYDMVRVGNQFIFGNDREGLTIWNIESGEVDKITRFEDGRKIGSVYSVTSDNQGRVWFSSTLGGFGYVDNGKTIRRQNIKNPSDPYTSLVAMNDGNILLIRAGSIDLYYPGKDHIMYFDKEVGIVEEPPFLNNFSIYKKEVLFAHDNYLYEYSIPENYKIHPEISLDKVVVNLTEVKGKREFKQNENNVQFHFTGSWMTDYEKITYQYQLIGFDEFWRETKDRMVSYPKLEPGEYTFRVRASENNQFDDEPEQHYSFKIKKYFYNTIWFRMIMAAIIISLLYRWRVIKKNQEIRKKEIEAKHAQSQLASLKSQLNPHFLFNAFNTLLGLIEEENTDKSVQFVETLTDFYRQILEHGKTELVDFNDELQLVLLYLDILNERFNDAILLENSLNGFEGKIPPLTLQLLVENAVKHNQISNDKKLNIKILKKGDFISIVNNKNPKNYPVKSTGSGLTNIRKRYLLISEKNIKVNDDKHHFEVLLPII